MNIRKGDKAELYVDRVAFGGRGVARLDGLVVFVDGAVPGDRIIANINKKKRSFADASLIELITPSPDRVEAPCPHSTYCGGCQWQHLAYDRQLDYKKMHVKDSITRIGGLPEIPVMDVIPSERIYAYRNKMEFSFSDQRWLPPGEYKKGQEIEDFGLGLHAPGIYSKVIDMDACLLQADTGNLILREVKEFVKESGIPVYGLKSHKGFWRFLTLRYSQTSDLWMVNIVTSEEKKEPIISLAKILSRKFERISTVVNNINSKKSSIATGEKEVILFGDGFLEDNIGPYHFRISSNSFFQTNTSGAQKLYEKVLDYAELEGHEIVLDLYCGTGTIPIFVSGSAKEIIGMEINESAIFDAKRNCIENNVDNCHFILGDIREKLSKLTKRMDVMIIDPPRAGIHKDILEGIMGMVPERVVYVSCNPTTLARDLKYMSEKYDIIEVQPVDMFPQTYHIESVAKLIKKGQESAL